MAQSASNHGRRIDLDLPADMTIKALAYLLDGRLLAAATGVNRFWEETPTADAHPVQIWDVEQTRLLHEFRITTSSSRVAIDRHGATIAISADGVLNIRSVVSGQPLWHVAPHRIANAVAFSADGHLMATAGPYGLRDELAVVDLWDASTGENLLSLSPGFLSADDIVFSPDGSRFAVVGIHEDPQLGAVCLWSSQGELLWRKEHDMGGFSWVKSSRDGNSIVTGGGAHCWDAANGEYVGTLKCNQPGAGADPVFFHPDAKSVVGTAHHWVGETPDFSGEEMLKLFQTEANPFQSAIDHFVDELKKNPPKLSAQVMRWDFRTGQVLEHFDVHLDCAYEGSGLKGQDWALSVDGKRFAYALHDAIEIWELS